ncbi:MAG: acyltransferase [Clostridia bacterium]|nr:acyltransferase [Clostridia bacterium]
MQSIPKKSTRNQTLEWLKLLAAVMIVYVHIGLPGKAGKLMDCLVRFSVPLFFAISGYFSFGVPSGKLFKRLWHIIKLNLLATAALTAWDCFFAAIQRRNPLETLTAAIPTVKQLGLWVLVHVSPFGGHLWYLAAAAAGYAVLTAYAAFFGNERINYRPLYIVSAALLAVRFAAADMLMRIGIEIPYYFLRDGWFYAVPMMGIGLFLREYQQQILDNYRLNTRRLLAMLFFGVALSLIQYVSLGPSELPLGAIIQMIAMILLSILHPRADFGSERLAKLISCFGTVSTTIYILQFCAYDAYAEFMFRYCKAFLGPLEIWVRPTIIATIAGMVGMLLILLKRLTKKT